MSELPEHLPDLPWLVGRVTEASTAELATWVRHPHIGSGSLMDRVSKELANRCEAAEARATAAEQELASIDSLMARRPALDKPTRWENIQHAISTAALADRAERLHDIAVKRADEAEAKLAAAEQERDKQTRRAEEWKSSWFALDRDTAGLRTKLAAAEQREAELREQSASWRRVAERLEGEKAASAE